MIIFALWCHPRSVSTAFERIMRERGDVTVLHEPFMYHHYLTRLGKPFPAFDPDPDHPRTYGDIRDMIRAKAATSPVFFKDMAYYVEDALPRDPGFVAAVRHSFLIRDPVESVLSYARLDADLTCHEIGIEAQWHLYRTLVEMGHDPQVINAADLRADPRATMARYWAQAGLADVPEAFDWDARMPAAWEQVKGWHGDVIQSRAIRPENPARDHATELAALGGPFCDYAAYHRLFYDRLNAVAQVQMHGVDRPE